MSCPPGRSPGRPRRDNQLPYDKDKIIQRTLTDGTLDIVLHGPLERVKSVEIWLRGHSYVLKWGRPRKLSLLAAAARPSKG